MPIPKPIEAAVARWLLLLAVLSGCLLMWPFLMAVRAVRGQQGYKLAKIRKRPCW